MERSQRQISRLANAVATEEKKDLRRAHEARHEESRDLAGRERRRQRILVVLTVVLVVLTAFNLSGLNPLLPRETARTDAETELWVLSEVEMVVDDVENWRVEWGTLPETIEDFIDGSGTWSYRRLGDSRYQVSLTLTDTTVSYDSGRDPDEFFAPLYAHPGGAAR